MNQSDLRMMTFGDEEDDSLSSSWGRHSGFQNESDKFLESSVTGGYLFSFRDPLRKLERQLECSDLQILSTQNSTC